MELSDKMFYGTPLLMALQPLTPLQARAELEHLKETYEAWEARSGNLRKMLYTFEQRGGYQALGYKSMEAFFRAEFAGKSAVTLSAQLEAARVEAIVAPEGEIGTIPRNHLRPLHKLLDEPEKIKETYEAAQGTTGKVTERKIRNAINVKYPEFACSRLERGNSRNHFKDFETFFRTLNKIELAIRERGGFAAAIKTLSPRELIYVTEHVDRYHEILGRWRAILREED